MTEFILKVKSRSGSWDTKNGVFGYRISAATEGEAVLAAAKKFADTCGGRLKAGRMACITYGVWSGQDVDVAVESPSFDALVKLRESAKQPN